MRGEAIMNDALKVINGERQNVYGNPEDTHETIAAMWQAYLNARGLASGADALGGDDVANMMVLMKVARQAGGKGKRDNYVDMIGYAALAHDMQYPESSNDADQS